MSFATSPNLVDYTTYVYAQGVPLADLPANSDYLVWSLRYGEDLAIVDTSNTVDPMRYVLACYQCAFHYLLRIATDMSGQTYFQDARQKYALLNFVAGAVISSSDEGTSQTLAGSEAIRNLSIADMGFLKTPWGVMFLEYQQSYGPNVVGFS